MAGFEPSGGASNLLSLTDFPSSYTGNAGKVVTVNGTEDGVEFVVNSTTDEKVKVDSGATAGYLGAAYNDGVLRTDNTTITVSDGGDFITLALDSTLKSNYDSAYSHVSSTSNPHSVTKAQVGLTNVEDTALSTWAGSANLTTLGTVTSGTLSTGAVVGGVTMTLGTDADFDMYYRNSNVLTRLAPNTAAANKFMRMVGTGAAGQAPSWEDVTKTDVGLANVENTALSTWAGTSNIVTTGTITSGGLGTGAVIGGATITLTSDADFDMYTRSSNVLTRIAPNTTATQKFLAMTGTGAAGQLPTWETVSAGAFATAANITSNSPGTLATDDFVFGSTGLVDDGDATHDARMLFDKSKYAFCAGRAQSTQWDSLGDGAAGFGTNCTPSGTASFTCGTSNTASGANSFCGGESSSTATNTCSFAFGNSADSTGAYSLAFGYRPNVSSDYSACFGSDGTVSGAAAFGIGQRPTAYLAQSMAHGTNYANNQYMRIPLYADTTNATPETLTISNGLGKLTIPASTAWLVEVSILAHQTATAGGGTVGNCSAWKVRGILQRDGSNNTTLKWSDIDILYRDDTNTTISVAADDTDEEFAITITGVADCTYKWVGTAHIQQVA